MTAHDDELTTQLNQELHVRVDTITDSPLTLGDVRGKARSIRRRRAAISIVAAAAAVAVVIPTAALASHHVGSSHSLPPATQNVTPSPSSTPPSATTTPDGHQPAPGVLDVSDLSTGTTPAIAYLSNGVLHRPDGTTLDVGSPGERVYDLATLVDGTALTMASDNNTGEASVTVTDVDGTQHGPFPASSGFADNASATAVAWTRSNGVVSIWQTGLNQPLALDTRPGQGEVQQVSALVGDDCTVTCTAYVNVGVDVSGLSSRQAWAVGTDGSAHRIPGGLIDTHDVRADGAVLGYSSVDNAGSCSSLVDADGTASWKTCRHTLDAFSPDGSLVLAGPSYRDGIGDGVIAMYDAASGDLAFSRASNQHTMAFYSTAVWEDTTHALAPVFQDGRWAIVRFASDGSMEYAVPPVKGNAEDNPIVLAVGR